MLTDFLLGAGRSRQTAALAGRLQVAPSTVSQEVKVDPDSPFDYQLPKVSAEQLKRIIHKLFDHPNMFTIHDCQRATARCMLNYKQNARSTGNCRSPNAARASPLVFSSRDLPLLCEGVLLRAETLTRETFSTASLSILQCAGNPIISRQTPRLWRRISAKHS